MIDIINYGLGNLNSILNIIHKVGGQARIINNPSELAYSKKLILPGVGSFDHGMKSLIELGWKNALDEKVLIEKTPILGICLGMQLMCKKSEEGVLPGLGWIDAEVKKFEFKDNSLKIPHMGWNTIQIKKNNSLLVDTNEEKRFYFVHSFFVKSNKPEDILTETNYPNAFTSAFIHENIHGVQFHPEKSHRFGMELLSNYLKV